MEYDLIRSNRKTLAIYITKDACLEVRAPLRMKQKDIDAFLETKKDWIEKHLSKSAERNEQRNEFRLIFGSKLLFCGKEYPLEARNGKRVGFDENCFFAPESLTSEQLKQSIISLYKILAKNTITERVEKFADIMKLSPANIKINSAKTRWGSCSSNGNLNFSWRLILAPDETIDYVVVHELSHMLEPNHSYKFWAEVEKVLPDYKQRQSKLKELQKRLAIEDWD